MAGDGGGLHRAECSDAGLCPVALADGNVGHGGKRNLYPREQHRTDVEHAAVLDHHPSETGECWGYPAQDGRTDHVASCVGISVAEGG